MGSKKNDVMDEYEKQIKEIDRQLKELGNVEVTSLGNFVKEKDQKEEALNEIKEIIAQLNEKEDLKKFREENLEEYQNMILTIVSWFNYLKNESKCYIEAKESIRSFGEKHEKLREWCNDLVGNETFAKSYESKNLILNIKETDTLIINDNLKIVVNLDEYKKYIKDYQSLHLRNIFYSYRVIDDKEEYVIKKGWKKNRFYKEEDKPCPYLITVISESIDSIEFSMVI